MPFGRLCIFERNSCTLKRCSLSLIQIEKAAIQGHLKTFFRLPSAFSPQIYHPGYLYLIQYFWSNIQIMNIMSFAQMEFVFILPKVSNTQMLRTFYLMYVFQKGGIQRLKIDIYANFIFWYSKFFKGKNLIWNSC